ncbi:MAG: hypothetical protein M1503_00610 [Thaumarchaeota archaeon]|nr:hypothetical protein [Nitrososphaerota archaeon]MCL5316754.1 hypothetical protein [Nitrososphaerota archaeon]
MIDVSVLDFASAQRWKEHLVSVLPHMTVENYVWALQVFCRWAEKNPDELISERKDEMAAKPRSKTPVSSERIAEYQLADKSKTKQSKTFIVKAVAAFYENNRSSID